MILTLQAEKQLKCQVVSVVQRHNEATQARKPDRRRSVKLHRAFGTLLVVSRLAGDVAQGAKGVVGRARVRALGGGL